MGDENETWSDAFSALRTEIDSSVDAVRQLIGVIGERFRGHIDPEIDSSFNRLVEILDRSRRRSDELFGRFVSGPLYGFVKGRTLTREEYYMTLAAGLHSYTAKAAGLSTFDDFEIFNFFCYEDEERRCYINPSMEPLPPGRIRLHGGGLGEPPEELWWSKLRPEQQAFFSDYLPNIADRFKRSL